MNMSMEPIFLTLLLEQLSKVKIVIDSIYRILTGLKKLQLN